MEWNHAASLRPHRHQPRASIESLTKEFRQISVRDARALDREFSKEILQTSTARDRARIQEEIHGVSTPAPKETPELLETSLEALSRELCALDHPLRNAYDESQVLSGTYVNTPEFRLRFLRHELFDARKAALRMATFLDLAADLFGPRVLERPIRLSDFDDRDREFLSLGTVQFLPYRDRTGRPVCLWQGDYRQALSYEKSFHRVGLYLHYIVSNDVESQKKGVVKVFLTQADPIDRGTFSFERFDQNFGFASFVRDNKRYQSANPIRTSAYHVCVPDTPFYKVFQGALRILVRGNTSQARLLFHCGNDLEMRYLLKTYGIPVELIPPKKGRIFTTVFMKQFLRGQQWMEENHHRDDDSSEILFPRSNDVLYRKGSRNLTCHPGNAALEGIIESKLRDHSGASQSEKKAITVSIIRMVEQTGGRFLSWNPRGCWEEIPEASQIHAKVASQVKQFKFKPVPANAQTVRSGTVLFQNQDHAQAKRRKTSHESGSDCEGSSGADCGCVFGTL